MGTDTGEKLDIAYTTDSLLVATPTDSHTSVMITRLDDELSCVVPSQYAIPAAIGVVVMSMMIVLVNGYVFVVHLMFKELRTMIGKLLILRSLFIILMMVSFCTKVLMLSSEIWRRLITCHFITIFQLLYSDGHEAAITCILHCFAYILYRSNKLQKISEEESKSVYKWYITYILGVMFLATFLVISYDIGINRGAHILPSGECTSSDEFVHSILNTSAGIQKSVQIFLFFVYLYYKHQFYKDFQSSTILRSQEKLLRQIAIAIGATIGISCLLYFTFVIFDFSLASPLAWLLFMIQQGVVLSSFLSTKKMKKLYKECFSKN